MDQSLDSQLWRFSSGTEVASFVTSSGLLQRSWDVITSNHPNIISNIGNGLSWNVYKQQNFTIIAIEATLPNTTSNLQDDLSLLFYKNHETFDREILNYKINKTPLIVTGHGLGGAIASQLTISLLEPFRSAKNSLLCITFGSPLVGNKKWQQAILRRSIWNSSFLHVVSHKDPLPRRSYTPFGTFLLCSDASSTCCDNPDSVLEILNAFGAIHVQNQGFQSTDYGNIVENLSLNLKAICKGFSTPLEDMMTHSGLPAIGISLQLQALGFTGSQTSGISMQQQQQNIDVIVLKPEIKKQEETFAELNNMTEHLAQLNWYSMVIKEQQIGYYESYKNRNSIWDYDAAAFVRELTIFWEKMVEETDMMPRRERMAFQLRRLYAGTNYRRMVEPLAIAEYYRDGGKNYINERRSEHFKRLEQWLEEGNIIATRALNIRRRKNVEFILTIDSCFWAHVEEALLSCKQLNHVHSGVVEREEAIRKLVVFENYVYGQLKNYAVSPEIFFNGSSYMRWWNQYKKIKGSSYSSSLESFMNNADNYNVEYVGGTYDFTENSDVEYVGSGTYNFTENSEGTLAQSETQTLYHFLLKHLILCCCPDF